MPPPISLTLDRLTSPIGEILLVTDEAGRVRAIDFHDYASRMMRLLRLHYGDTTLDEGVAPAAAREALTDYFDGQLDALPAISWATGGTAFQRTVWTALLDVPAGTTSTYAALAARIGKPAATRAVGAANGANPIAILVPCHRLVGANGSLTGYAGGLERKQWLLRHEGVRF
ncbi:MAG: methylated-DNA--protein-cysteine methyltransferase [Caulobacter sp. 12-67-6]|nr:MAG: methylated-DNA--protein-cysteine methyltransferase [Caulobacter sp. 12-67-6]OYX69648.1 MAG: methylated-DNA--protein-cysteine methyltransferase [Caulobacter sp. 32-67-35]OYX97530.1 MAG: methylated-DNA--protein-cysteine methyltransferase [Caulobacter sp. 35-67-4]OZA72988.1 MAG: methylated-DNA--protein-cysteine methyltransferase [Caulobacter sp. 39-67-4]HQR90651.1 methylated-DNA--[protein]-cysteine S-methyltransferase [Caulobacter sp.]